MTGLVSRARRRAHLKRLAQDVVHLVAIADELLDVRTAPPDDDGLRSPSLAPGAGGTSDPTAASAVANADRPAGYIDASSSPADIQEHLRRHIAYLAQHTGGAMRLAAILRPDLVPTCASCRHPYRPGTGVGDRCDACYRRAPNRTIAPGQPR